METPTTANDVADYLIFLAAHEREDDPDFLTPLKLQKLLYFAQGWAYAEWGRPLFGERIEAWQHGPVVREVRDRFKNQERRPIEPGAGPAPTALSEQERALVRAVWDAYKQYSAFALSDLTHDEPPYLEAYKPDAQGRCSARIEPERIKRHFVERAAQSRQRSDVRRARLLAYAKAQTRAATGRDVL